MMIIKRGSEYTPIIFNQGVFINKKYAQFKDEPDDTKFCNIDEMFNMPKVFEDAIFKQHFNRVSSKKLGKGFILAFSNFYPILAVVVYLNNTPTVDIKKLKIIANNTYFCRNLPELARLKKQMNAFGMSSRTQLILKDNDYIKNEFTIDLLAPTMDDYEKPVQEVLTKEFLATL